MKFTPLKKRLDRITKPTKITGQHRVAVLVDVTEPASGFAAESAAESQGQNQAQT